MDNRALAVIRKRADRGRTSSVLIGRSGPKPSHWEPYSELHKLSWVDACGIVKLRISVPSDSNYGEVDGVGTSAAISIEPYRRKRPNAFDCAKSDTSCAETWFVSPATECFKLLAAAPKLTASCSVWLSIRA